MEDDKSTSTDTAEEAVDTSVNVDDASTDSDDDVDLEDIEVSPEDIASEEEAEESDNSESEDTEATDDESSEEESELSDEQRQAEHNKAMFEQRQQEKQARIARVKQEQAEYIAGASENPDPLESAVRQLQVTAYNNTVEATTNQLTSGYDRALNDYEVLRNPTPEIQAEINEAIEAFEARYVTIDGYGNPTEVRGDLYEHLQAKADSIAKLTGIRSTNQDKSKSREKSKTLTLPGRAPKEAKTDPDMDAFDEEAKK
jgi:chromosome segregation ATPase